MSLVAPAEILLPESRVLVRRRARSTWMSRMTAVFLAASIAGAVLHRSLLAEAWNDARSISPGWWVGLVGLVLAHRVLLVTQQWAAVTDVGFARMALGAEANLGASNAVVGGSAIGTALRVTMWRSWGVDPVGVAVALFLTALCPSFAMWALAGIHTWPDIVSGHADRADLIIGVGAVGFLVVPAAFWSAALLIPSFSARLARLANRIIRRVAGRVTVVARLLDSRPIPELSEEFRTRTLAVIRRRGLLILSSAIASQLMLALLLVASLHAVGAGQGLDPWEVMRAFALVRVGCSFVPIPGGIGVMEIGIVGALTTAGATRPEAVAALAVYRGLTFFMPIVTGTLGALIWRRRQCEVQHQVPSIEAFG